ncbi:hypothetical protein BGZ93_011067 [Podila epicladia]|nr:hypothetical protein BGZ93_011067 [Podila epicladia]
MIRTRIPMEMKVNKMLIGTKAEDDDDQSYMFTFNDFVIIMTPGNDQYEQDELSRVFQLFDTQGKGYIRMEDLKRIAGELGITMSDQQLEEMIDEADRDGNGAVTAEEFGRVMKKTGLA